MRNVDALICLIRFKQTFLFAWTELHLRRRYHKSVLLIDSPTGMGRANKLYYLFMLYPFLVWTNLTALGVWGIYLTWSGMTYIHVQWYLAVWFVMAFCAVLTYNIIILKTCQSVGLKHIDPEFKTILRHSFC